MSEKNVADAEPPREAGEAEAPKSLPEFKEVSWFRQLYWASWKNCLLLSRRPILLCVLLLSGVISVVLSWTTGGDPDPDEVIYPPFTDCGAIDENFVQALSYTDQDKVQFSLNEQWRSGVPLILMILGPLINSIIIFIIVHEEIHSKLLGVLRALGLRDSVYWASWYLPFVGMAFLNALLGAITAATLPGHVYENVYFGGVFASLFFLQLALAPASFFLAALCGTSRKACANFVILIMLVAAYIPAIVSLIDSWMPSNSYPNSFTPYSRGLFWQNTNTYERAYNSTLDEYSYCNKPILSEFQGKWYKTDEERATVENDEYFVGCYAASSWGTTMWNSDVGIFMFLFPYYHFNAIWGNFVGYTSMPNRSFTSAESSLSAADLAIRSLPSPPDPSAGLASDFAPQGSTFVLDEFYDYNSQWYTDPCPAPEIEGSEFCSYLSDCGYAEDPGAIADSPSTSTMYGFLLALSVGYLFAAAYWAQVFPNGNGRAERFYFPFLPSYWFGRKASAEDVQQGTGGVVVTGVKKAYGAFEALKGVSFKMAQGEVTALLGHNGAGKSTLSNIICCDTSATEGDINVFGHSVASNPFAVRSLVGLCKQDDYLWTNLSAKEHLELFAGLRGVDSSALEGTVQTWLESVDLDLVQYQYASAYSGGMKRRLSVALATIGNRPLIVLDEPTTGMDPVSRRFVWRHIDSIKEGRVILLTTHAMEEADLLADEVAIIRKGELAAFGSPLQLKTEYGTALQFSLLVDKPKIYECEEYIHKFFADTKKWVDVQPSTTGSIIVRILALKQNDSSEGVDVEKLAAFVAWLDDDESPVSEYGFSNSSLEEVFLKVTEGDEEADAENEEIVDGETDGGDGDVETNESSRAADLSSFRPKLTAANQTRVLFQDFWVRSWTGKPSIGNHCMFGILILGSVLLGLGVASEEYPIPSFILVTVFLSLLLVAIIGPVYADRSGGQFYLMRTQGLLPTAYITGTALYAFSVQFAYNLVLLSALFGTSLFRESVCEPSEENGYCYSFGSRQQLYPTTIYFFYDEYEGQTVKLEAVRSPGGYGMMFGIIFCFATSAAGAALSTSFFPGYRIPMVLIMFAILAISVWPFVANQSALWTDEDLMDCYNTTNPGGICDQDFFLNGTNADFMDCVGMFVNSDVVTQYCLPPSSAILPQFGLYQTLSMTYMSDIRFLSEPANYVEDVFIPSIQDVRCKGDTCSFPEANRLYGLNLLFMLIGAVILLLLGCCLAYTLAFPVGPFLKMRQAIARAVDSCRYSRKAKSKNNAEKEEEELVEVGDERESVEGIIGPHLVQEHGGDGDNLFPSVNHSGIPRDEIAPVIMHKLRKVYPALGGRAPKVALESLDLHVPKGQVLGLLGKNGAGKTTALKILSGAHDSSGGVGLVAGYDSGVERISVFERLGNCAQFDCVWAGRSVQRHLEFFAQLKGLPKAEVKNAARDVASAVGLGSDEVYERNAGALSGGMRRRLSIAMALLGSPAVVILDEPTTGLDPSTRSSIWGLINSFASNERSMIITTHMMIEADTLCNRIAIVAHGKLKVVGTQQHLKNKFGSGYLLQLNLVKSTPECQERAMSFVREYLHPDARLGIRQAKTLHVNLPRDLKLQHIFTALYSEKRTTEGGINQFLLSQSSLEDVFISLGD